MTLECLIDDLKWAQTHNPDGTQKEVKINV
jgi:hypothetical protein